MNLRAEDFLLSYYLEQRHESRSTGYVTSSDDDEPWDDEEDWDESVQTTAQIDALEAIGLLDASEAADWRGKIDALDEATGEATPPSNADGDTANAFVDALFARRDEGEALMEEILEAWEVFVDAGLILESTRPEFFERLNRPAFEAAEHCERTEPSEVAAEPYVEPPPILTSEIEFVLPGPNERRRGLRVMAIEGFDDSVVLRTHRVELVANYAGEVGTLDDEVQPGDAIPHSFLQLADDVGTKYRPMGGGGGACGTASGNIVEHSEAVFSPAVPSNATVLRISDDEVEFEVKLR